MKCEKCVEWCRLNWTLIQRLGRVREMLLNGTDPKKILQTVDPNPRRVYRGERHPEFDLQDIVMKHVTNVLIACDGNRSVTAEMLGVNRTTLHSYLTDHKKIQLTAGNHASSKL